MKYRHHILGFAAITTIGFTAVAQEIYKNVDKKGVVEFSDTASPGAKAVDVDPNVVDLAPGKPVKSTPQAKKPGDNQRPTVTPEDATGGYYSDHRNRRERRGEREERMDHMGVSSIHDMAMVKFRKRTSMRLKIWGQQFN